MQGNPHALLHRLILPRTGQLAHREHLARGGGVGAHLMPFLLSKYNASHLLTNRT
jgi:hypothetical protein